jgi:thiol:disulfide interchange protein DsbD
MKKYNLFNFLVAPLGVLSIFIGLTASADSDRELNENPLIILESHFNPSRTSPGGTVELQLKLKLDKNFHAYADRFQLKFENPDEIKIDKIKISPLIQFKDVVSGALKEGMEGEASLTALTEFNLGMQAAKKDIDVALQYQACSKETCLFPKTIHVKVPFELVGTTDSAPPAKIRQKTELEGALNKGIVSAIFFVFMVGFLTSLTPCIYPMIPITLAVLGAKSKGQTRLRSFLLSITYVLGIAVTYSCLGMVAASTGSLFGSALSNVYVVTAIALVFVVMGLSMYGLFEIQAPAFIRNKMGAGQTQSGYAGAFVTGLVAGIVASPCIGPVLVSILAYIAQTQNLALGFILLFTFALGMGVLFVVLGTFSQLFNKVPKAGAWMDGVKFIFGTTMVGMGLYYVAPIYPIWLFQILLALTMILIASHFGAFESNQGLTPVARLRKGIMVSFFVIGLLFAILGTLNKIDYHFSSNLAAENSGSQRAGAKMNWKVFKPESLAEAKQKHQVVIIDFSAEWCGACKELEKYTFTNEKIIDESQKFTLLRVDATEESPSLTLLKNEYKIVGLPTMIFIDANGQINEAITLTGFEEAPEFLKRMKQVQGQKDLTQSTPLEK